MRCARIDLVSSSDLHLCESKVLASSVGRPQNTVGTLAAIPTVEIGNEARIKPPTTAFVLVCTVFAVLVVVSVLCGELLIVVIPPRCIRTI